MRVAACCSAVCCGVLQCVAVFCRVLQRVSVCFSVCVLHFDMCSVLRRGPNFGISAFLCCSVLQCVALCCSALQEKKNLRCVASWPKFLARCASQVQCVAVCGSILPCVAVCCRGKKLIQGQTR